MASTGKADGRISIRKVTDIHSNWSEQGEAEDGKFSFQLILDNGAQEAVIMPDADDTDVLMDLFSASKEVYFDTGRQNIIFNELKLG